ncbi:MAG TPA: S41 family peptidase [Pyrinomonadaceae bacterium]|nr:S41 family peptidase [Pyrinomonadaceae bacterium]
MKNRLPRLAAAPLSFILVLSSLAFAQQPGSPRGDARRSTPGRGPARERLRPSAATTAALEEDFSEALSIIQENYVDGVKLDYNSVFKSSIIGMLRSLDPHSNFYDAKEFEELQADWRSEYYGIGASIIDRRVKGETGTYIIATFENAPAFKAGLRFGDRIVEVDGKSMIGKNSAEVRDNLRGPKGTSVRVTVEKAATLARETVEITRTAVPQPTVQDAYMIRPGVGYVDMQRGFNRTTADEFVQALEELRRQGMTQLVLDLRNNPGGLLDQAVKVASQFLPRGQVILSQKGRVEGVNRTYESQNARPDTIPIVVLVNRNSASASEIVAGALQDHDRGLVIGETTFGKGLVQSIIPLEYGTALTLTSTKYYTPSGRLIQRDYASEGLYDYYTRGGIGQDEGGAGAARPRPTPTGPESLTDTGRKVYGGGGIAPDENIKPRTVSVAHQRLVDPIFAFTRELVNGRVRGFENYKVGRPIEFARDLKSDEYLVTDNLFKAFKTFTLGDETYKGLTEAQLDRSRDFVARQMRYDIASAAYGTVTASQALVADDPQVAKAIEVLPRARELALAAQRGRNPQSKTFDE